MELVNKQAETLQEGEKCWLQQAFSHNPTTFTKLSFFRIRKENILLASIFSYFFLSHCYQRPITQGV